MSLITERTDLDAILIKQINLDANLINVLAELRKLTSKTLPFTVTTEIIRPANTTAYTTSDIINNDASPNVLPMLDFGIANAGKTVEIKGYKFARNYAINTWAYDFYFYNSNVIVGQNLADNQAFNPSFAEQKAKLQNMLSWTSQDGEHWNGTASGVVTHYPVVSSFVTLDANGQIFLAVIVNGGFTPVSASIQDFTFFGVIL